MSSQKVAPVWHPMPRRDVRYGDLFWGVPGAPLDRPIPIVFAYAFSDGEATWVATSIDDLIGELPEQGRAFERAPWREAGRELLIERPARDDRYAVMRQRALDQLGDRERLAAWLMET